MKFLAVAAIAMASHAGVMALNVHDFPKTAFSCRDKNAGEYYADLELGCQVYHICAVGQFNRLTKMSFACPNGTLFSQSSRICNSEDKVYCPLAERYYDNVQGNIDTQDDYKTVFQVNQNVFPLEPRRPARRPAQDNDDDYEDDNGSTAAPRRPAAPARRNPVSRPASTTTTTARPRPPPRQFTPQVSVQQSFSSDSQDNRLPAGNFLPPRANTRNTLNVVRPQLAVTQSPLEYLSPQRPQPQQTPNSFIPPQLPASQANRPNVRRPNPLGTPSTTSTTAAPSTSSTTADPSEYEYYDYEEPADGQNSSQ